MDRLLRTFVDDTEFGNRFPNDGIHENTIYLAAAIKFSMSWSFLLVWCIGTVC